MVLCVAICVLLPLFVSVAETRDHVIVVDSTTGTNDSSCLLGDNPCATLNKALEVFKINYRSTKIYVSPGNYTLEHREMNNITGKDHVAIIGSGETNTIVNCKPSAGLYISNTINVTVKSIALYNCGLDTGLSLNIEYSGQPALAIAPSALTFSNCTIVLIKWVTISNSIGSGLVFYQVQGNSIVSSSTIQNGFTDLIQSRSPRSHSIAMVGGAIVLVSNKLIPFAELTIFNSTISQNELSEMNSNIDCYVPMNSGAITLALTFLTNVFIDSSNIVDNSRGLSVYDAYHEIYYSNKSLLQISNTDISQNNMSSSIYTQEQNVDLYISNVTLNDSLKMASKKSKTSFFYFDEKTTVQVGNSSIVIENSDTLNNRQHPIYIDDQDLCYSDFSNYTNFGKCQCGSETTGFITDCTVPCPTLYSSCSQATNTPNSDAYYNCSCYNNRDGPLCGQCKEGHSVAINSPYLECVPCDNWTAFGGWCKLVFLEFIPVTVMVAVIAVLNVNLNQGSLKAYIFLSQMLSIPVNTLIVLNSAYDSDIYGYPFYRQLALFPYSIWNLGFIEYPSNPFVSTMTICLSTNTTPLGAIVFWYVIGVYPFLLLAIMYGCIIMYNRMSDRNTYIVHFAKKIHRSLARFWQMFNIQPSLPHTIASVYTLCFTRLAAISFQILTPIKNEDEWVFFYDGSQRYFSSWHGAASTLALIVLIVFIIIPTVYLTLYPFEWFQKCLNTIKNKRLIVIKQLLVSVTDVYTAPYKSGTEDNTKDYKGIATTTPFLSLTIIVLLISISIPQYGFVMLINLIFFAIYTIILILVLVILRPYKVILHLLIEVIVLLFLYVCLLLRFFEQSFESYVISNYFYIFPALFATFYCFFGWFLIKKTKCCGSCFRQRKQRAPANMRENYGIEYQEEYDNDEYYPDRMANPTKYKEKHVGYKLMEDVSTNEHTSINNKPTAGYGDGLRQQ